MNNDSYILKEEMYQFLKSALVRHVSDEDPDEGIRELVDICLKKLVRFKTYYLVNALVCCQMSY